MRNYILWNILIIAVFGCVGALVKIHYGAEALLIAAPLAFFPAYYLGKKMEDKGVFGPRG